MSEEDTGVKYQCWGGVGDGWQKPMTTGESENNPAGSSCGFFLVHRASSATVCWHTRAWRPSNLPALPCLATCLVCPALHQAPPLLFRKKDLQLLGNPSSWMGEVRWRLPVSNHMEDGAEKRIWRQMRDAVRYTGSGSLERGASSVAMVREQDSCKWRMRANTFSSTRSVDFCGVDFHRGVTIGCTGSLNGISFCCCWRWKKWVLCYPLVWPCQSFLWSYVILCIVK